MEVIRVKKDRNYTVINNTIFKDGRISCKSKGIFATIMSLPDDWDFSVSGMSSILKEGKTSIYSSLDELISFGYVLKKTNRNDKGIITGVEYKFFETPINKDFNPHSGFPETDNPETDNPDVENQPQLSTNIINNLNNKNSLSVLENQQIDFDKLLVFFNTTTGKNVRVVNEKTKKQFNARLKEGYTKADIFNAIKNCHNDDFHKKNPKYLTLEFISRADKLEKYSNYSEKKQVLPKDFWKRELTDEQKKLLSPENLKHWERQKSAMQLEGGRLLPIKIVYEGDEQ